MSEVHEDRQRNGLDFGPTTLASVIDVGQGTNIGSGKFAKKNKQMFYVVNNNLTNLYVLSNRALGPGKKSKINKRRAYVYSRG